MEEATAAMGLIDEQLMGDVSSVYTTHGALSGPNSLVLPPRKPGKKRSAAATVIKAPSKRSVRAAARQQTKERLKRIKSEVTANMLQLSAEEDQCVRNISLLLSRNVSNTQFELLYAQVEKSGAKIPAELLRKHAKIQKVLAAKAARETADDAGDF